MRYRVIYSRKGRLFRSLSVFSDYEEMARFVAKLTLLDYQCIVVTAFHHLPVDLIAEEGFEYIKEDKKGEKIACQKK